MIPKRQPRRKRKGLTPAQRREALDRRDGHVSAWTGRDDGNLVPQHRANRGVGGSPVLDNISNLVWLEADINGLIESDPAWQAEALARGIKVRRNGPAPDLVPCTFADGTYILDQFGGKTSTETPF